MQARVAYVSKEDRERAKWLDLGRLEAHVRTAEECTRDEAREQIVRALGDGAIWPLHWEPEPTPPPSSFGPPRFPGCPPPARGRDDWRHIKHWLVVKLDWESSRMFDDFERAAYPAWRKTWREVCDTGPLDPPKPRKSVWRQLLPDRAACEAIWPPRAVEQKAGEALRNDFCDGADDPKPDGRDRHSVEETAMAGKAGLTDDLRKLLDHNHARSDQAMPDRAELRRLPEALTELRASVQTAVRTRQTPDVPADVVAAKMQMAREGVDAELLGCLARDQFAAFLETIYGFERLPWGEYWLRPNGSPRPDAARAFISGTASSMRHCNLAGIVMVRSDDFRAFGARYLAARGLADVPYSSAAPRPRPRRLPPPTELIREGRNLTIMDHPDCEDPDESRHALDTRHSGMRSNRVAAADETCHRSIAAPDTSLNRHWKPLGDAVGSVTRRHGIPSERAWAMLKADIAKGEIKARCSARRYDHQRALWIETWRNLDPRRLGFIAYECTEDDHLRFDLAAAARARLMGEEVDRPPEHARGIVVVAGRLDDLYPPAPEEHPPPSPLKHAEAAVIMGSVSDQPVGRKPIRRRPSREKPFWPEARKEALKWLEENGFPRPGDGGQAKLEVHVARCGYEASESTIRVHVKVWIEEYIASLAARE